MLNLFLYNSFIIAIAFNRLLISFKLVDFDLKSTSSAVYAFDCKRSLNASNLAFTFYIIQSRTKTQHIFVQFINSICKISCSCQNLV